MSKLQWCSRRTDNQSNKKFNLTIKYFQSCRRTIDDTKSAASTGEKSEGTTVDEDDEELRLAMELSMAVPKTGKAAAKKTQASSSAGF